MVENSLAGPARASPMKIATLTCIFLCLLMSPINLNSEAELSQTNTTLNLSCLSESSCLLDNSESGMEVMTRQESSASPLSPKIIKIEFIMNPSQSHLALLPNMIDELVVDLRIQEDSAGINSPDIIVEFWAGRSSNTWTIEGGSPTSPKLGDYHLEDAELDLSQGRLVRPGDGVGLSISFEIDQPITWELYLRGNSRIIVPIEWSANIAAENVDEPSSAGNPVQIADVETLTRGALLDADQDCFEFQLPDHLRSMTIIVFWTSVPIEIEQPHTPPELIREGGKTPKNPAVKTTFEAGEQITEIHYEDPLEGKYLACWTGKNNHFQSYSWFAKLALEGLGSASPSEFSGDANWLAGEAYVGNVEETSPTIGSNTLTLMVGLLATAVAFSGFALPINNIWLKKYLLPVALLILIVGGIASPVWGLTDEAPITDEMTLDEAMSLRMQTIEDGVNSEAAAGAASNFFGVKPGDTLSIRLHVTEAHPTGDGRWQVHTEEMANIRIDSYVFGWIADHPMGEDEEVRFILQSGRALTLDLLMLESLLVVDNKPEGELLHVKWKMTSAEPAGSATEPIWSSRPESISAKDWNKLQTDLYPQLLTISYCDCGIDGMEISWRSSDNFNENSIPNVEGISIADGFLSNEYMWLAGGIGLILIGAGIEYSSLKKKEEVSKL